MGLLLRLQQLFLKGTAMPYPGEIINGMYQIIEEIGKGGVGVIYRAYHLNLRKYVVVKKIKDDFAGVLEARGEVDILKSLHHSCLPQVYDFIQRGSEIYTVMDFIEGHDLKYYIDQGYSFEEETLWQWMMQLCEVLEYLHRQGILHLDIKPANIMLTPEGKLYLIDFNISFTGSCDTVTGISPYYASPEQYRKWNALLYGMEDREAPLDAVTDIYSLGATFYHLMTGVLPTADLTSFVPITAFRLNYSAFFISVIDHMMAPQRKSRYQSAEKVLAVLRKSQRTVEEKRTLKIVFWGMFLGIAVLLVVLGVVYFKNRSFVSGKDRENLIQQRQRLQEMCDAGEYEEAYKEELQFLNDHADIVKKMEGSEEAFLSILVECCMGMEAYQEALTYTETLLELHEQPQYYCNAAVAAAYLGDYTIAENYLILAQEKQGDQEIIGKTRAEIKASQGDYQGAVDLYKEVINAENEAEILRRIAIISLEASKSDESYAQQSVDCYEKILKMQNGSYSDQMNLTTAYLKCGMNEKALSVLQEMTVIYPEKYEVFQRSAILRYQMEMKKAPSKRDFTKMRKDAEQAVRLYEKNPHPVEDDQIAMLKQLLETGL